MGSEESQLNLSLDMLRIKWYFLLAGLVLISASAKAQPDLSKLSSKERIELAQNEMKEAAVDTTFLREMDQGHNLFADQHYLKAIHKYEEAQKTRPNNVYPKVIITDIELSMKDTLKQLRQAEAQHKKEQKQQKMQPTPPQFQAPDTAKMAQEEKEREKKQNEWINQVRNQREAERKKQQEQKKPEDLIGSGDVKQVSVQQMQSDLAKKYPQGVTETKYKEGNKMITERVVVKGNVGDTYRKVEHAWGGIFYFKDGQPITEDTWKRETE